METEIIEHIMYTIMVILFIGFIWIIISTLFWTGGDNTLRYDCLLNISVHVCEQNNQSYSDHISYEFECLHKNRRQKETYQFLFNETTYCREYSKPDYFWWWPGRGK